MTSGQLSLYLVHIRPLATRFFTLNTVRWPQIMKDLLLAMILSFSSSMFPPIKSLRPNYVGAVQYFHNQKFLVFKCLNSYVVSHGFWCNLFFEQQHAATVLDGKLYIAGGSRNGRYLSDIQVVVLLIVIAYQILDSWFFFFFFFQRWGYIFFISPRQLLFLKLHIFSWSVVW